MGVSLSLQRARSFWYIERVVAKCASRSVVSHRIFEGIVLGIGWCVHWLHLFEGGRLY